MARVFLLIFICFLTQQLDAVEHVAMIDAGSSGSRIFIYEIGPQQLIKLKNKLKIKPGLAEFESNLPGIKPYLNQLLEFAKKEIGKVSEVPLVLQATGGLRALSKAKQRRVIQEAQKILLSAGFKNPKAEVISGEAEGIYQWKALTYLLKKQEFGLVEMGGASLQVVFKTGSQLYSRTYEGFGETWAWNRFGPEACKDIPLEYKACRKSLDRHFKVVNQPGLEGEFYLVDYFEQLASLLKLETLSSESLDQLGPQICHKNLAELKTQLPKEPEYYLSRVCFQVAYMSVVLEKIGFERTRKLIAAKEIEGTAISWTLGSLLDNMPSSQKAIGMP